MSTIVGTCSITGAARLDAGHAGRARPQGFVGDQRFGAVTVSLLLRIFGLAVADVEDHLPRRQRRPLAQSQGRRPYSGRTRCR